MSPVRHTPKSLSGKIFRSVLLFTLAVVLVFGVMMTSIAYFTSENEAEARLDAAARNAAVYLNETPESSNEPLLQDQFSGEIRYTLIDEDGTVLYDSAADASSLPNHGARPEVQQAENRGSSAVTRYSETLGTDTVYAAVRLDDGGVLRLSETRESLLVFLGGMMLPVAATLAVVAALVFVLSRWLTKRLMQPIDALNFADPLENEIYEEMDPLLERIDEQQQLLKQQNEELARAENLRRDFSSNVSHEMKTPLQVISGYAELMKNDMVQPSDRQKVAGLIYEEAQAMRSLINDVLTLSRLDESAFEGDGSNPIDVRAVADRVAGRLASFAAERGVRVTVEGAQAGGPAGGAPEGGQVPEGSPARIMGSETLVEEMLYNLIENGIRYNHEGGSVVMRISEEEVPRPFVAADRGMTPQQAAQLRRLASNGDALAAQRQVVVRVSDTGPGIPADKHEKIFERFYRLDKSRSKETGGTGLGLAIVKHAVLYHKGTIEVESEEGKGATFVLRFPAA